jgi:hypothetical protein
LNYWNLLPDGTEIDLTREQLAINNVVQKPRIIRRPARLPKRGAAVPDDEQRVLTTLIILAAEGTTHH